MWSGFVVLGHGWLDAVLTSAVYWLPNERTLCTWRGWADSCAPLFSCTCAPCLPHTSSWGAHLLPVAGRSASSSSVVQTSRCAAWRYAGALVHLCESKPNKRRCNSQWSVLCVEVDQGLFQADWTVAVWMCPETLQSSFPRWWGWKETTGIFILLFSSGCSSL